MAQGNGSGASGRAGRARRRLAATGAVALLATAVVLAGAATALAKPAAPVLAFTPSPYDYGRVTPGKAPPRGSPWPIRAARPPAS